MLVNLNGRLEQADEPLIKVQNRAFRYGDGLFETMKCVNGTIRLWHFHYERLFSGIEKMMFAIPGWLTPGFFFEQIELLIHANKHDSTARVRLMIFRGNGSLQDTASNEVNFLIESSPLHSQVQYNELVIDIYPDARKSQDMFSSLKSNNFLPYIMAANHAKKSGWDDAVLLNTCERICDTTIANIFIVKNNVIYTPALSEGCVAGTMRRYLLEQLLKSAFSVKEFTVTRDEFYAADEIFLTNAVSGIRIVKQAGNSHFNSRLSSEIRETFLTGF